MKYFKDLTLVVLILALAPFILVFLIAKAIGHAWLVADHIYTRFVEWL